MNGILNVYKEPGFTSHDVVAKLRGICKQKKIGHTGTLDPEASGVLPVCLGNATKLCEFLTDKDKEYEAVMLLGVETDTQDTTGQVLRQLPVTVSEEEVRQAVNSFAGPCDQIPPMYSALKINGQKLCDLARAGKVVERKSRPVTIHSIEITGLELPRVRMRVCCSRGTYIRTLCHDIGQRLGCGAAMETLVRTRSGSFELGQACRLSEIEALAKEGRLQELLQPADSVFAALPARRVTAEGQRLLENGNPLTMRMLETEAADCEQDGQNVQDGYNGQDGQRAVPEDGAQVRVYGLDGTFTGLYAWSAQQRRFMPVKMFL
ncbi:MAG: tRNA pseudouridine(55) synthase TruB [Eubacteriales bacterium]|nr:tRNA pseudouridine(55) synthase TruB [Eubacteriales bacterium]